MSLWEQFYNSEAGLDYETVRRLNTERRMQDGCYEPNDGDD